MKNVIWQSVTCRLTNSTLKLLFDTAAILLSTAYSTKHSMLCVSVYWIHVSQALLIGSGLFLIFVAASMMQYLGSSYMSCVE